MKKEEIEITINEDGSVEIDMIGYDGQKCKGDVDDLIKFLGKDVKTKKKSEYYRQEKIKNKQIRKS